MSAPAGATVSVIVPAWNAAATLPACLTAIAAMGRAAAEVIVFDDGSTDATGSVASAAGTRVLVNPGPPAGPAHGRNLAAAVATSALLLFVDADVVVAPDALDLLIADMTAHGAAAAFGSYDDQPRSLRAASLYANLRHHFVHQHGARDAGSFWAGLGLIDRQVFLDAGGFDAARFPHPSIEDIELGARLRAQGYRIRLVREAQGKHWKDWTLRRVWHTDIVRRAWPWARLIVSGQGPGDGLNVAGTERAKAGLAIAAPALAVIGGLGVRPAFAAAIAAAIAYVWLNFELYRFFAARLRPAALLQAIWMHWCYHVYATAVFGFAVLQHAVARRRPAGAIDGD